VVLVCGTALFIYLGWKSETRAQARRRLEQEAQQTAAESQKAYWLQQIASQHERANDPLTKEGGAIAREHEDMEKEQRLNDLAIKTWDPFWEKHHYSLSSGGGFYSGDPSDFQKLKAYLRNGMTPEAARSQLEDDLKRRRDMQEVKAELHRANTLADDAAFQHRLDEMRRAPLEQQQLNETRRANDLAADAAFQLRMDKIDAASQRRMDKLDADSQRLAQEIS
jgi:hypothetical protein